ncbi:hypothetical protein [Roseateles violae]|uniref:DUF302 domain-containing protein n=1 Tax=Roseateles violae TaxID=3058042 RepID=A0ABT8DXA5_9BURK|nr:hypothetical protein [Pelomonas sp. PFR6]MDN3921347.1 hypothetical protein [Pelomonas sp. PFR6]
MRKIRGPLLAALLLSSSALTLAAPAPASAPAGTPYIVLDHSTEFLMDGAVAGSVWKEYASDKVRKLYPAKKWGFVSQVMGGFTAEKTCVVTARAMILPRARKELLFKPAKTASTFGAIPNASNEQCKALARTKLGEAIGAIESALIEH